MANRKPMEVLAEQKRKVEIKIAKMRPKVDRAHQMAEKWAMRAEELDAEYHQMSEKMAGLNGHLYYAQLGAVQYEINDHVIKFYDQAGNEVQNPEVMAMVRRLQNEDQKKDA